MTKRKKYRRMKIRVEKLKDFPAGMIFGALSVMIFNRLPDDIKQSIIKEASEMILKKNKK